MSKQRLGIPTLSLPNNKENASKEPSKLKENLLTPPSSEEDRIVVTPTTAPAFSDFFYPNGKKLNLEYFKSLSKDSLQNYFNHNTLHNQNIFYNAVEQNEIELVKHILKIKPNLINIQALPEEYNILHIALLGVVDEIMIEILLKNKPKLVGETDKENLTPLMFGEKYGFGKALSNESIEKIRKTLEKYENDNVTDNFKSQKFPFVEYLNSSHENYVTEFLGNNKLDINTDFEDMLYKSLN